MLTELKLPIFFTGFEDLADEGAKEDDIMDPLEPLLSVLLKLLSLDWLMMAKKACDLALMYQTSPVFLLKRK